MRALIGIGLLAAMVLEATAQRRGFPVIGRPANPSRAASPGLAGSPGQPFWHHQSGTDAVVPVPYVFAVPVYVGGSDGTSPSAEDPGPSNPSLADEPFPIVDTPPVHLPAIVNGHLENAEAAPAAQPICPQREREDPVQFFIALKDGLVTTAVAYWVRERTLHYLTLQGSHNVVSLALVDRQRSAMLNKGGRVPLILPP